MKRLTRTTFIIALVLSLCALQACGDAPVEPDEPAADHVCGPVSDSEMVVIREIGFVQSTAGESRGLNLDGLVSDPGDSRTCGAADFVSPAGEEGIDNNFSLLLPALETATGGLEAVTSAIQRAINEGAVLVTIESHRWNGTRDDSCVEVDIGRGTGRPLVGGDGLLVSGQTLERDTDAPSENVPEATMTDGVLTAGPISLGLPMNVAQFELFLTLEDAYLQMWQTKDGVWEGLISGAIVVDEVLDFIDTIEDGTALLAVVRQAVQNAADLEMDDTGTCKRLSITLSFEATEAYFYE